MPSLYPGTVLSTLCLAHLIHESPEKDTVISSFNSFKVWEEDTIILAIWQMRKLKHRYIK